MFFLVNPTSFVRGRRESVTVTSFHHYNHVILNHLQEQSSESLADQSVEHVNYFIN